MKTWFVSLAAVCAALVGASVASAGNHNVAVRVGGGSCYSNNVGVSYNTVAYPVAVAVPYPVAMAYPVAAPAVAAPIPYAAPQCEVAAAPCFQAVSAPAAPVCYQAVSAPVAFAAPAYSYSAVGFSSHNVGVVRVAAVNHVVAVNHNVVRVAAVNHNVVRVAAVNHNVVRVAAVNNFRVANNGNVRVAVNNGVQRIAVNNGGGLRVNAAAGGGQNVSVVARNGIFGQRVVIRAR